MRTTLLLLLLLPCSTSAQLTDAEKKAALSYILAQHDAKTGGYRVDAKSQPGLRATLGALRAWNLLANGLQGSKMPDAAKSAAFVLACYDPANGSFKEPGGQPDATITAVGIMAAAELGILDKCPKAIDYLMANAKTFEEVRMAAAAVEALKQKPAGLDDWMTLANSLLNNDGTAGRGDGQARETASVAAMKLRLGYPIANREKVIAAIRDGQRSDGGWGKAGAKTSDLETTYRVMRALMLLKEKPKDAAKLTQFLGKCRNSDSGFGVEPGAASTLSGVYYAASISKWLGK